MASVELDGNDIKVVADDGTVHRFAVPEDDGSGKMKAIDPMQIVTLLQTLLAMGPAILDMVEKIIAAFRSKPA